MRLIKLLMLAGLIGFGWNYWQKHQVTNLAQGNQEIPTSPRGFISLPPLQNVNPGHVVVVAPLNCPSEQARRADDLVSALQRERIPVTQTNSFSFQISGDDAAAMDRINEIQQGEPPIVFVYGRAKSSPSLEEVIAEYREK